MNNDEHIIYLFIYLLIYLFINDNSDKSVEDSIHNHTHHRAAEAWRARSLMRRAETGSCPSSKWEVFSDGVG